MTGNGIQKWCVNLRGDLQNEVTRMSACVWGYKRSALLTALAFQVFIQLSHPAKPSVCSVLQT